MGRPKTWLKVKPGRRLADDCGWRPVKPANAYIERGTNLLGPPGPDLAKVSDITEKQPDDTHLAREQRPLHPEGWSGAPARGSRRAFFLVPFSVVGVRIIHC